MIPSSTLATRLARVDGRLERLEDVLPADHDHRVDPGDEQVGHGRALKPVGVVLQPVDLHQLGGDVEPVAQAAQADRHLLGGAPPARRRSPAPAPSAPRRRRGRAGRRPPRRSRRCRRARRPARARPRRRAGGGRPLRCGEAVQDVVDDPVALLLAQEHVARQRGAARDSRPAGRAAAARRAGRCARTRRTGRAARGRGADGAAAPLDRNPPGAAGHGAFTTSSRRLHGRVTGRASPRRKVSARCTRRSRRRSCGPGSWRSGPSRAPGTGARPHAVALGPRARAAGGAGAPRRPDRAAGGAVRDGVGRAAARRRTARWTSTSTSCARSWRTRSRSGGSSTPTSGSATASSRSLHTFFTGREQAGNRWARRPARVGCDTTKKEGLMRTSRFMPALARGRAGAAVSPRAAATTAPAARRLGASSSGVGGTLNGAGATFPQPVYQEWAARFQKDSGTTVNYQGIGSGGGIAQFTAGTVDFGASDSAMTDEEITAAQKKGEPGARPDGARRGDGLLQPQRREVRPQARRRRRSRTSSSARSPSGTTRRSRARTPA